MKSRPLKIRNPKSTIRNWRGFTLLEVMVAVTIMAMVLVTLLGLKNSSMRDVALAEHITTATMLAKRKMVETTAVSKNLQPVQEDGDFAGEDGFEDYTWKRTIILIPLTNHNAISEVRVAVLWKEGSRQEMVELVDYE